MLAIKTEVGRLLRNDSGPDLAAVEASFAAQIARYLGSAIRKRVEGSGDLAGQRFPGWDAAWVGVSGKKYARTKAVSSKYPDRAQGRVGKSGAEYFDTSADYHAANQTKRGTYHTTGGMWSGLSAVVASAVRATVMFRGRSDGQDARVSRGKSRPLKVSNALKAWTVYDQHGVNVLLPNEAELQLVADACTESMAAAIGRRLEVKWDGTPPRGNVEQVFAKYFRSLPLSEAQGA